MRRRLLAAGASAAVLAAGGGIALAATGRSSSASANPTRAPAGRKVAGPSVLEDAAKRLGVTPAKLHAALAGAMKDRLERAVKAGHLSRAQANRIEKHLAKQGSLRLGFGFAPRWRGAGPRAFGAPPAHPRTRQAWPRRFRSRPPGGPGFGHRFGPGPGGPVRTGLTAAARYLGLTPAQLMQRMARGQSLAAIASAQHKDLAGLKASIRSAVKARLDHAVKNGRLSKAMESRFLQGLDDHIDDLLHRTPGRWHP